MATTPLRISALDALLAALNAIGPIGATWRTDPEVVEGIPGDALPAPNKPRLYVQWLSTGFAEGEAGTRTHSFRSDFVIWITGVSQRDVLNADEDVLDALVASESTIASLVGQPWWHERCAYEPELTKAGLFVAHRTLYIVHETSHA